MKTEVFYDVHSDEDENNVFSTFVGRGAKQAAIRYAKDHKNDSTWVDKVIHYIDCDEYEYECIWSYAEED